MNQNKHILIIILCLPFLLVPSSSSAMFARLLKTTWRQEQHIKRLQQIKDITTVSAVDTEIEIIKNNIYKECLTELASLINRPYDDLKKETDKQRTLAKILLHEENPYANHDPNIPDFITQNLRKALSQHSINPNNIDFKYEDSNICIASAFGGNILPGFFIAKPKFIQKPRIRIYNKLLKLPQDSQEAAFHHEISHIVLQHKYIIDLASNKLSNINTKEEDAALYTASETHYQKKGISYLASFIEKEADINASLTNSQIAYSQALSRCSSLSHAFILDQQNHCEQLKVIYQLMIQKEKLTISES